MKIKKEFEIKGKQWRVEYKWSLKAEDGERVKGLCDFGNRTIYLDRLLSPEDKFEILQHELVHAALYEAHLNHTSGLDPQTEEIVCDAVVDMFNQLFTFRWKRAK